jgi:cytochrome c553
MVPGRLHRSLFCLVVFSLPATSLASIVNACIACHGADGMGKSDPTYPVIAGIPTGHIEEALFAYVDGARKCGMEPRMCIIAATLSDEQVAEAAAYFAAQVRGPNNESFDADLAAVGERLHERHCGSCHKAPDDKNVADAVGYPLHGQRGDYIRYAIRAYLSGGRESLLRPMAKELATLSPDDVEALINFYASYRTEE